MKLRVLSFGRYLTEDPQKYPLGMFKCFFLAGGPGAGKSSLALDVMAIATHGETSFSQYGLNLTSSDVEYERLLHDKHVNPRDLEWIEHNNPALWHELGILRHKAKDDTNRKRNEILSRRAGIVYDGTGEDYEEKEAQRAYADSIGYDTFMIFVTTPLELSLARNADRERKLPENVVMEIWENAEANRPKFAQLFGKHYIEIPYGNTLVSGIKRYFIDRITEPVENPIGLAYLEQVAIL